MDIIQITAVEDAETGKHIFGLGKDGKVYLWNPRKELWEIYVYA